MRQAGLELADVFRRFGGEFLARYGASLSWQQQNVIEAVENCRTSAMGGHKQQCDSCGHEAYAYNSCRNRHCPKCQGKARMQWMQARAAELLPTPYFHVVFTLPQTLAALALQNKSVMYGLLFRATAATLKEVAANPEHLGARIGFFAVLHTWGQRLEHHPHLHCVIPAGGLSPDSKRWIGCRQSRKSGKLFFLPVAVLSQVFRGKFIDMLRQAYAKNELSFYGKFRSLKCAAEFERFLDASVRSNWVVYAKRPFGNPECVLKYLSRYTHRIAMSNARLQGIEGDQVVFRWKNYRRDATQEAGRLDGGEFMRRFLQHVLPKGFTRIRHFGIFANRVRSRVLEQCRELLATPSDAADTADQLTTPEECEDAKSCPACKSGQMYVIASWERGECSAPTISPWRALPVTIAPAMEYS